jgi:hypothetical protein
VSDFERRAGPSFNTRVILWIHNEYLSHDSIDLSDFIDLIEFSQCILIIPWRTDSGQFKSDRNARIVEIRLPLSVLFLNVGVPRT